MKKFRVEGEFFGRFRGYEEIEIEANTQEDAIEKWQQGLKDFTLHDMSRVDIETGDYYVEELE